MRILTRQSVNTIGFSEVRSVEQLKFVVNAALTGHCLTTFHGNSINDTLQRLANFHYAKEQAALFLGSILHQHWDVRKTEERSLVLDERIFQP
jgi:Tfp pilus assembly ATPase PilU